MELSSHCLLFLLHKGVVCQMKHGFAMDLDVNLSEKEFAACHPNEITRVQILEMENFL